MNKKKYLFILVFIVVVVLIVTSTNFKPSSSMSRYRSDINGSSGARVAKWDVKGIAKNGGESVLLDAGFTDNITEGKGNWFFDIENDSELNAEVNSNSTITLRLAADSLSANTINWDFLTGSNGVVIDNPVNFIITAYNASAKDLISYVHKDTSTPIGFEEYGALSDELKAFYNEVINADLPNTEASKKPKVTLLDTKSDALTFNKKSELVDGKIHNYYELSFKLSDKIKDKKISLDLGFGNNKTNICFRIEWSVEDIQKAVGDPETPAETEVKYCAYTFVEGAEPTNTETTYELDGKKFLYIDGKNYYIRMQEKNFFDYLRYTSTLGGEPQFEFASNSGIAGSKMLVFYSKLTADQKATIEAYEALTTKTGKTAEDIKHIAEYLEYTQYKAFVLANQEFAEKLPYLSMGLTFSVQFDLRCEQKD